MPDPPKIPLLHPFPILEIPTDLAACPWARATLGLDGEELRGAIAGHLPLPADPALARLREKLLTYHPAGIVTYSSRSYLQLDHPEIDKEDEGIGESYYLGYPALREEVAAAITDALHTLGIAGAVSAALIEFYALFPGLREDFQCTGHFIQPGEWHTLGSMLSDVPDIIPQEPWASAICLYHARNGDDVVLSSSGEVAWYCIAEAEIIPIASDFSGFLDYLIGYLDLRWPLDSYGPD
ncbi:hypothetical protein OJ996_11510 [Luteolibacter sp. GHJ8]|uniref:SMI1/KNR4 family protein n=1 Tax=Luteolibacter rhizosphaerae TaxID=2989719 RepID=A0ABT3G3Y2_9BACT|nr:hypothetical protein [Luteolibacter rhizosphaerae]MCW1914206.1 hypothetical protein [Luteolibacter rhizosphaerae]